MADLKPILGAVTGIAAAVALIASFIAQQEGHASHVYKDVGGVLTVCYGHTGKDIIPDHVYTDQECNDLLIKDTKFFEEQVLKLNPELADKPNVLKAATSFMYNVGVNTYAKSSVMRDFKAGNFKQGCADIKKYVYAGHKYSRGLNNRRGREYKLCMEGL